ncbi:S8 family serine peptidase [Niveibacterium sp. SC-1]|uniref:S8 family peptidase n=1 Tax=Niveibacterium sp. SC-1 TaxID=3135646 RepID=UPI00311FB691
MSTRGLSRLLLALACMWAAVLASAQEPAPAAETAEEEALQVLVLLRMPPEHFRADANYAGSYADGLGRNARRRIARQIAQEHGLRLVSDWPMPALRLDCYVMAAASPAEAEKVVQALSRDNRVDWVQGTQFYRGRQAKAADPLYAAQPTAQAWRLADLHQLATGRDVRVAVVDSGTDWRHPDLAGQVVAHENFVGDRSDAPPAEIHGTAVAGLLAAREGNGMGIVGVAPRARVMALRACRQESEAVTLCSSLGLAKAIYYAITNEASIINLSLAGPPDRLLERLIDAALARGVTIVAAYDRALHQGGFPASHAGVIAVAGDDGPPPGAGVLRAPARDLPTTGPGGRWLLVSGASYAAAQVSGFFALLRELDAAGGTAPAKLLVRAADGGIDTCATLMRLQPLSCACQCAEGRPAPLVNR